MKLNEPPEPISPEQSLLERLWRDPTKHHYLATQDPANNQFKNILIAPGDDRNRILSELAQRPVNIFFACAEYGSANGRKSDNVSQLYSFFVDIDVGEEKARTGKGYQSLESAQSALNEFCDRSQIARPNIVIYSGSGIHAYWTLDQAVDRDTWKKSALKLKALAKAQRFLADPSRTADAASVLRVPGKLNHKYSPPRKVEILTLDPANIPANAFLASIDRAHDTISQEQEVSTTRNLPSGQPSHHIATTLTSIDDLDKLLERINADLPYEKWTQVGMAIFHETGGSSEGLDLYDEWSKLGKKYKNRTEIEIKWRSFKKDVPNPITVRTLYKLAKPAEVTEEEFTICETIIVEPETPKIAGCDNSQEKSNKKNPLQRYSLTGYSDELARSLKDEVHVLDRIAISGQATMIFAAPNSGKTLLTLHLLIDSIIKKRIDPDHVYYINVDDTSKGLVDKLRIVEEYGFHMLGEGHRNFMANQFLDLMIEMTTSGSANGTVIILDTVKRFTDMMDKTRNTQFTAIVRRFVTKGGTLIGLGHVNKNPGRDGKPVHSGTSDLVDDFDCAHILSEVERMSESQEKVVAFSCIKRRGNVASEIAYRYSIQERQPYNELLLSVTEVDEHDLGTIRSAAAERTDADLIDAVRNCIKEGINTKMQLVKAVSVRTNASHKAVIQVIEKYTGPDPEAHHWFFEVRARGAKCFVLHKP